MNLPIEHIHTERESDNKTLLLLLLPVIVFFIIISVYVIGIGVKDNSSNDLYGSSEVLGNFNNIDN